MKTRAPGKSPYPEVQAEILALLHSVPDAVLLDAGCGNGHELCGWLPFIKEGMGIDISAENVQKGKGCNLKLIRGDVHRTPFRASSFDIIIANYVVEHIGEPTEFVQEMARILRSRGVLTIIAPNVQSPMPLMTKVVSHKWQKRIKKYFTREEEAYPVYYRLNTVSVLNQTMVDQGFIKKKIKRFGSSGIFSEKPYWYFWFLGYLATSIFPQLKGVIYAEYIKAE